VLGLDFEIFEHAVFLDIQDRFLQGPLGVMNFCSVQAAFFALAIETIAFGRPLFE